MRDMIRLDQLPPPLNAKKGRYGYVEGHPAPVWIENSFDWWQLVSRIGVVVALLGGLAAIAKAVGLLG